MRLHRSNKLNMSHSHMMLVHCQRFFFFYLFGSEAKFKLHAFVRFGCVRLTSKREKWNWIKLNARGGESCARFNISHERGVEVVNSFNGVWMLHWALLKTLWTTGRHYALHSIIDLPIARSNVFFFFAFSFLQRQHISLADFQKCMLLLAEINQINQTSTFFTARKQQTNIDATNIAIRGSIYLLSISWANLISFFGRTRILWKCETGTSPNCQATVYNV